MDEYEAGPYLEILQVLDYIVETDPNSGNSEYIEFKPSDEIVAAARMAKRRICEAEREAITLQSATQTLIGKSHKEGLTPMEYAALGESASRYREITGKPVPLSRKGEAFYLPLE